MDRTKPTTQLLGRFQPWHKGHTELFERAVAKTGQVIIMLREMSMDEENPYTFTERCSMIERHLSMRGYSKESYDIMSVPNITHITYGRDVGYKIEREHLDADIEGIRATNIRQEQK